jgi:Ca-activated chloride channel homolog
MVAIKESVTVEADYVLDYDVLSMAREHHLYLLARIKAGATTADKKRRPLNLSVVLDRSGSMAGEKLEYVKTAAQFLVQHLAATDRFSLVTYNEAVAINITPTSATHKDQINQVIKAITAGGMTNLSGGWMQGCQFVLDGMKDGQSNRVLLLTDGLANEGVTEPSRLASMARHKYEEGVTTTTMGVGMDFNEDLLTRLAAEGGGAFYFIDNPEQAPRIFSEELQDLLSVVGQNLVITLTLSKQVRTVKQLNAYPSDTTHNAMSFRLGDLYSDEIKSLLLELSIPALGTLGEIEVARLRFDYDELGEERVTHRTLELPITINTIPEAEFEGQSPNAEVTKTALLLRAARAREEAIHQADTGKFDDARKILTDMADDIEKSHLDDKQLQTEHNMLREEAVDMEMGEKRYDAYTRKVGTSKMHYGSTRSLGRFAEESESLHSRLKSSRQAIERDKTTPKSMTWNRETLDLNRALVRIGRADDNDVVIPEEEVSRYHCQIVRDGDNLFLEDLKTRNGTFANGGLIQGRFRLSAGDIVTVGSWLFRFTS